MSEMLYFVVQTFILLFVVGLLGHILVSVLRPSSVSDNYQKDEKAYEEGGDAIRLGSEAKGTDRAADSTLGSGQVPAFQQLEQRVFLATGGEKIEERSIAATSEAREPVSGVGQPVGGTVQ